MRCNPWRWLWGVIPIAMLTWLACTWEREGIETDLRSRSEAALEAEGYNWGEVSVEGRDASLTGVAPDDSQPYRATETVRKVKGVRIVRSRTDAAAPQTAEAPSSSEPATAPEAAPTPEAPAPVADPPAPGWTIIQGLSTAERAEREKKWRAAEEHERQWRSANGANAVKSRDEDDKAKAREADRSTTAMQELSAADRADQEKKWRAAEKNERQWRSANGAGAVTSRDEDDNAEAPEAARSTTAMQELSAADRAGEEKKWRAAEEHERQWRSANGASAVKSRDEDDKAKAPEAARSTTAMQELSAADRAGEEKKWRAAEEHERQWRSADGAGAVKSRDEDHKAKAPEAARLKQAEEEARDAEEANAAEAAKAAEDAKAAAEAKAAEEAKAADDATAKAAEATAAAEKQRLADVEAKRAAEEEQRKADEREQAESEAEAQRIADERAKAEEEAAARQAEQDAALKRSSAEQTALARQKDAEEVQRKAEADRCQGLMRSAMAEGVINFDRAKADLTRDSFLTLDRLAGIVKVCPQARINIAGHTDGEGEIARNQGLSERRAKAVGDYLIAKGVEQSRVTTEGFGKSRPIAPNDTPEGRRTNRRIEFNVTPAP